MTSRPGSETAPPPESGQWKVELGGSYEVLLGKPLGAFDPTVTYTPFYWDGFMSAAFFDDIDDVGVLGTVTSPDAHGCDGWGRRGTDLGRSLFFVDDGDTAATDAALCAASRVGDDAELVFAGADFARVLSGLAVERSEPYLAVFPRVDTDGTLVDAMRAATRTTGGPDDLVAPDPDVEVDEVWEKALRRVGHPGCAIIWGCCA